MSDESKIKVFTYTIKLDKKQKVEEFLKNNFDDEDIKILFITYINSLKTLVSRVSTIITQNSKDDKSEAEACILLETKHAKFRQNFDDMAFISLNNN